VLIRDGSPYRNVDGFHHRNRRLYIGFLDMNIQIHLLKIKIGLESNVCQDIIETSAITFKGYQWQVLDLTCSKDKIVIRLSFQLLKSFLYIDFIQNKKNLDLLYTFYLGITIPSQQKAHRKALDDKRNGE